MNVQEHVETAEDAVTEPDAGSDVQVGGEASEGVSEALSEPVALDSDGGTGDGEPGPSPTGDPAPSADEAAATPPEELASKAAARDRAGDVQAASTTPADDEGAEPGLMCGVHGQPLRVQSGKYRWACAGSTAPGSCSKAARPADDPAPF